MLSFEMYVDCPVSEISPTSAYFVIFENDEPVLALSVYNNPRNVVKAIDKAKSVEDLIAMGYKPTDNWVNDDDEPLDAEEIYGEITSVDAEYYRLIINRERNFLFEGAHKEIVEAFLPDYDEFRPENCYQRPFISVRGFGSVNLEDVVAELCGKPEKVKLCADWLDRGDLSGAYRKELVRMGSGYLSGYDPVSIVKFDKAYSLLRLYAYDVPSYSDFEPIELSALVDLYAMIRGYDDVSDDDRDELLQRIYKIFKKTRPADIGWLVGGFVKPEKED